jgi:hypothetical protein
VIFKGLFFMTSHYKCGFIYTFLFLLASSVYSFKPIFDTRIEYPSGDGASSVATGDFNQDGYPDLAVTNLAADNITIHLNNGDGTLLSPIAYPVGDGPRAIIACYFNAIDSYVDLAVANENDGSISILLGDGTGAFISSQSYSIGNAPKALTAGDFNGDGSIDIAAISYSPASIDLLLNDGMANFTHENIICCPFYNGYPNDIASADVDNDGDIDLAIALGSDYPPFDNIVGIFKNLGSGNFAEPELAGSVSASANPIGIFDADFDGDGDVDIAVAGEEFDGYPDDFPNAFDVLWNNGKGVYNSKFAVQTSMWGSYKPIAGSDIDNDGDVDIIACAYGIITWLNEGAKQFGSKTIYRGGGFLIGIIAADITNDGYNDIIYTDAGNGLVSVIPNRGNGSFSYPIEYSAGYRPNSVIAADLDHDEDLDLAVANFDSDDISVFINDGKGAFQNEVRDSAGYQPYNISSCDLDGDGHIDLMLPHPERDSVTLLFNMGDGRFEPPYQLLSRSGPKDVIACDLNQDNLPDLIAANYNSDNVSVFLNEGNRVFGLPTNYAVGDRPTRVFASDFDNDKDNDLAVANYWGGSITVFKNDGAGNLMEYCTCKVGGKPFVVHGDDFNGDGYVDLAVGVSETNLIAILINNQKGYFCTAPTFYSAGKNPWSLASGDIDRDGDVDLLVGNSWSNSVSFLENMGNGTFLYRVNYGLAGCVEDICLGDFNSDGYLDLAATDATYQHNSIALLLNQYGTNSDVGENDNDGTILPGEFRISQNYPNPFNLSTIIEFDLPKRTAVSIDIYNLLGQRVINLVNKECSAGNHRIDWDGRIGKGQWAPTGVYFYRIEAGDYVMTKKMLLLK